MNGTEIQNNRPLLSICIPTYNRAEYLKRTLQSIVSQPKFLETKEVEIIISDNCSIDNTREVSENFIEIYGDKIRYYRNDENILDANFEKVLSYGKGLFLKLNNDTLMHHSETLEKVIDVINQNIINRNIIFFANKNIRAESSFICENADVFVQKVSYWATWIGAFGIWNDDFKKTKNFSKNRDLQLVQTDVLFQLLSNGKNVVVNNESLFTTIDLHKKGGYDLIRVFLDNYSFILREQIDKKVISEKTYDIEMKRILINFFCSWFVLIKIERGKFSFDINNAFKRINKFYKRHLILLCLFYIKYCGLYILYSLKKLDKVINVGRLYNWNSKF